MKPKPPVSRCALGRLDGARSRSRSFVFYGLFTPFWFALRALAWLAEFRARRRA